MEDGKLNDQKNTRKPERSPLKKIKIKKNKIYEDSWTTIKYPMMSDRWDKMCDFHK